MKYVLAITFLLVTSLGNAGLINGGFEDPAVPPNTVNYPVAIPGWQTTDSAFEVWGTGFGGVASYEGQQHVELNAFIAGTLFQDAIGISAGSQVGFEFAHRGRVTTETMRLTITDLGFDNIFGNGDDTVLFTKQYTADTSAWVFNTSVGEAPIFALGNDVRFAYSAISSTSGFVGNFLDAADFGTNVNVCGVPGTPSCTIPTPTTFAIFGLGILGLGLFRTKV